MNYNVRSFRANSDSMLSMFHFEISFPDVLILSETWFKDDLQDELPSYNGYHTVRSGRRSGGVSVYARQTHGSHIISDLSFANENIEVCTVDVRLYDRKVIVIGIYRPHSGSVEGFIDQINIVLGSRELQNRNCILAGDFNINLGENSTNVNSFVYNMHSSHFIPLITKPTRFPPSESHLPSLLDHIWVNQAEIVHSGIILNDFTDHCPTFIRLPTVIPNSNSTRTKISFRYDCEENRNALRTALEEFDWSSLKSDDVNAYVSNFVDTLNSLYCESFPIKVKYISVKSACNPWVTSSVKKVMASKSKYFNLYKLGAVSLAENNSFKNKAQKLIRKSKLNYYRNLIDRNRNSIRGTWRVINTLACRGANSATIAKILRNGVEYTESQDIAEIFNDYFSSIAESLDTNLPPSSTDPIHFMKNRVISSLVLEPPSSAEVASIISNLKLTKQHQNVIPVKLIVTFRHHLSNVIGDMIKQCFFEGKYPDPLKLASITPVFKKGEHYEYENYRPIAVLIVLSKIYGRIMFNRYSNFFTDHAVITPSQFGFRKFKSTRDAILHLTEFLYQALNNKEFTLNIFIDYSRAFDTLNHKILLRKLEWYGIRGKALDLIRSYLADRRQVVRIGDSFSGHKVINIGVPQGSIMGPLLFLIYINDLPNVSQLFHPVLFADDTTLSIRHSNLNQLILICNRELELFHDWSVSNRLSINLGKTKCMIITTKHLPDYINDITLNNIAISIVNEHRFLGIQIDQNLKFNNHIDHICKKVSKSIGILFKIRDYLPLKTLIMLYYSFIYPYLSYCIVAWGSSYATHLQPLFILQKKAIRTINKSCYLDHTSPLFYSNNILKLQDIYRFAVSTYMYEHHSQLGLLSTHNYYTRNRNNLIPPYERLSVTQQSIYYQGSKIWNDTPIHIRQLPTLSQFKYQLKAHLISRYSLTT